MSSFATQTPKVREQFFRQYQSLKGIDPVIVEKDFWVYWLLARIFEHPQLSGTCLFKGGTSLSKVFHAIERFSEDIDLGITPASLGWSETDLDEAPSRTKREERNALLEKACAATVQNIWQPALEKQFQAILGKPTGHTTWLSYRMDEASHSPTLFFTYPGALPRDAVAYIAREVKIEFGSLTDQRPTGKHPIQAFVGELAPGAFDDFKTEVVALELERTFWEKRRSYMQSFTDLRTNQSRIAMPATTPTSPRCGDSSPQSLHAVGLISWNASAPTRHGFSPPSGQTMPRPRREQSDWSLQKVES